MFNISDYFKKFARIEGESLLQRDAIQAALKEVCGVEHVEFQAKKGVLTLKASPMVKSIVFMRKQALLDAIRAKDPLSRIVEVR